MPSYHPRNPAKHEYEVKLGESLGHYYFVGNTERTAIRRAVVLLAESPHPHARLYHTHPSPGPTRRYCGVITRDGTLRRPL